jgi:uncharacterized protein (TIGR02569 family)
VARAPSSPPPAVLAAFGAGDPVLPLPGGQGDSWRAGDLVLKPGTSAALHRWLGTVLAAVPVPGVRVVEAVPARDGRWVVSGWGATRFVDGAESLSRRRDWEAVVVAARALHAAWAGLSRPESLGRSTGPWARADRAAWGEEEVAVHPRLAGLVRRLRAAPDPMGTPQLVHGDLTTNVLSAPGGGPLVIDVSPYRRPPGYAEGIVLADALTWYDEPVSSADRLGVERADVARGLLFRVLTSSERLADHVDTEVAHLEAERYAAAVDALGL